MKTSIGKSFAEVFDADALEQIKQWADKSALACKDESQRRFKDHHSMAKVNEAIEDQMAFEALSAAIMNVRV